MILKKPKPKSHIVVFLLLIHIVGGWHLVHLESPTYLYLIIGAIYIGLGILWIAWGRDRGARSSDQVLVKGLDVMGAGVVFHEMLTAVGLSASLIHSAIKGRIKIIHNGCGNEEKTQFYRCDFILEKSDHWDKRDGSEAILLDALFEGGGERVAFSDLKGSFSARMSDVERSLRSWVSHQRYFVVNPELVAKKASIPLIALFIILFFLRGAEGSLIDFELWQPVIYGAMYICTVLVIVGSTFVPRTPYGSGIKHAIDQFKIRILRNVDDTIQGNFDTSVGYMEHYLPYTIVLGVVPEWLSRFKELRMSQLDWYVPLHDAKLPFEEQLHEDINQFLTGLYSALYTDPSFRQHKKETGMKAMLADAVTASEDDYLSKKN